MFHTACHFASGRDNSERPHLDASRTPNGLSPLADPEVRPFALINLSREYS